MADTTTYSKIREIVRVTRSLKACTIERLIGRLIEDAKENRNGFIYYRLTTNGTEKHVCSVSSVRRHIVFCEQLGFLTRDGEVELTRLAKLARSREDFNAMLETQVIEYLDKHHIPFAMIEDLITSNKLSDPETLYNKLPNATLSEDKFRKCLLLLSQAGNTLISYQKRMYLVNDGKPSSTRR